MLEVQASPSLSALSSDAAMPTLSVVQILTASIAPVIVISGVGLLLLSITNRYGRAIDRARALQRDLRNADAVSSDARHLREQLQITHRRACLLRASMTFGSSSIFFVSLTILSLFAEQVLGWHRDYAALPFFALCVLCLVVSMAYAIRDVTVSLNALELEMQSAADQVSDRSKWQR